MVANANTFDILREMTSYAKRNPATGLLNNAVIPAATPAQMSSVLYSRKKLAFCCTTDPMVADATTVETSMPVEPPKMTVRKPLKKCDGILYAGRFFFFDSLLSKISVMPLFGFF